MELKGRGFGHWPQHGPWNRLTRAASQGHCEVQEILTWWLGEELGPQLRSGRVICQESG